MEADCSKMGNAWDFTQSPKTIWSWPSSDSLLF